LQSFEVEQVLQRVAQWISGQWISGQWISAERISAERIEVLRGLAIAQRIRVIKRIPFLQFVRDEFWFLRSWEGEGCFALGTTHGLPGKLFLGSDPMPIGANRGNGHEYHPIFGT
jgi:hypothetical protein